MSKAQLIHSDAEYKYPKYKNEFVKDSHCLLEVYQRDDKKYVVVFTELVTNPGASITNRADILATKLVNEMFLDPRADPSKDFIFVERYDIRSYHAPIPESLSTITFHWSSLASMYDTKNIDHKNLYGASNARFKHLVSLDELLTPQ